MKKHLKIAIYSGEIPSTIFIERLIHGMAKKHTVLLFGYLATLPKKQENVKIYAYSANKVKNAFKYLKYSLALFIFKNKEKQKLDNFIHTNSSNIRKAKLKYYPVLWHKPDIFHLQWAKSITNWVWVQQFGIKLIVSLRGTHINTSPLANKKLAEAYQKYFPQVDTFHAVSKAIVLEAQKYGANPAKISMVYSGLQPLLQKQLKKAKTLNYEFKILSIGRNHWIKGYTYALAACKILKEQGFTFTYTIIGATESEELRYLINDYKLSEQVILTKKLPFAKVQELMQRAQVLLLPSVEEGIANVVLEAMQVETLVLTTACGGMEEVVQDTENGFVVPVRNPEAIAQKIVKISKLTENERSVITQKAQQTIQNQHTEQQLIAGMEHLYVKTLNNNA